MMVSDASPAVTPDDALQQASLGRAPVNRAREDRIASLLVSAGLLVTALFILASPEGLIHFDDLTHYLFAKWAWTYPAYLLDPWGRPGFTVPYFLPAALGWTMAKALSAILTAWAAWFAYRIACGMKLRHAWVAVVFAYAQPLFFQLGQTTLTETVLAFYLAAAVYLAQRGRWSLSSAILSLCFLTRHEAIVFLPVWVLFAWRAGVSLRRLWPILWAPVVVNLLMPLADLEPVVLKFFNSHPSDQYGRGSWWTFFSRSMEAFGPAVSALTIAGTAAALRARRGGIVATSVVVYFAAQTIVRALGMFDSGGYARFLVGVSPLVAVVALAGWLRLWDRREPVRRVAVVLAAAAMGLLWFAMERHIAFAVATGDIVAELPHIHLARMAVWYACVGCVGLAVVSLWLGRSEATRRYARPLVPVALIALMLLASYKLCYPLRRPPEGRVIDTVLADLEAQGRGDREIITAVVWLHYAKGYTLSPWRPTLREQMEHATPGTLFAWEKQFAASSDNDNVRAGELQFSPLWQRVLTSPAARPGHGPYLTVFERIAP